jgi:hypothetical protein
MRFFSAAAAGMAFVLAMPAWADPLPSLAVPTFTLEFTRYAAYADAVQPAPAAIGLLSTSSASTSFSLDSLEQVLHTKNVGAPPSVAQLTSTLHLEAAEGYRITGIAFSATVQGVLELPAVAGPGIVSVRYGDSLNATSAYAGIRSSGASSLAQLYASRQVIAPADVGGTVWNTDDLRVFDFEFSVFGASRTETTFYYSNEHPGAPWLDEHRAWGNAELHYADPVLTVYTEALAPVPEPGQWAMLLGGMVLVFGTRRGALREARRLARY